MESSDYIDSHHLPFNTRWMILLICSCLLVRDSRLNTWCISFPSSRSWMESPFVDKWHQRYMLPTITYVVLLDDIVALVELLRQLLPPVFTCVPQYVYMFCKQLKRWLKQSSTYCFTKRSLKEYMYVLLCMTYDFYG